MKSRVVASDVHDASDGEYCVGEDSADEGVRVGTFDSDAGDSCVGDEDYREDY